jgi:hypothetical protein
MNLRFPLIVCAMLLAGCAASTGKKISDADIQSFTVGKSTITDVEAKLGPPSTTTTTQDGTQSISYIYARSKARPETFIPVAGMFIGGSDTESSFAAFVFKNGVLTDVSQGGGNTDMNMGH